MITTITPAELAEALKITESELESLRRRNRWPHVKVGRKNIRFTEAQVEIIIATHTVEASMATAPSVGLLDEQTPRSRKRAS